jgi:hypothetical protein
VTLDRDGEAWRCTWKVAEPSGPVLFDGVGFQLGQDVFVSRSRLPREGEEVASSGIVVYDTHVFGRLPARWYHPDLQGHLGEGLSVDGPADRLSGKYRAEYRSTSEEFAPLLKELAEEDGRYHVRWVGAAGLMYIGVGFEIGSRLVVGWATPRREIDVMKFATSAGGELLIGKWMSLSHRGVGKECLIRA